MENLVKQMDEMNRKVIELKLWLQEKEVVEFNAWKKENPKDRTAMDKIIALLKIEENDNWLLKEQEYQKSKIELDRLKSIYNIVLKLLDRTDYTREDIEKFIEDLL
jgi:hypothetical protein